MQRLGFMGSLRTTTVLVHFENYETFDRLIYLTYIFSIRVGDVTRPGLIKYLNNNVNMPTVMAPDGAEKVFRFLQLSNTHGYKDIFQSLFDDSDFLRQHKSETFVSDSNIPHK